MPPYVYVPSSADNALVVIDAANPAAPALVGVLAGAGAPNFLSFPARAFLSRNLVYVASLVDDSLTIIDVTNPAAPVFLSNIAGAGAPNFLNGPVDVFVFGNYAYVGAQAEGRLSIINITNPAAPTYVGSYGPGGVWSMNAVYIAGGYAYVGSTGAGTFRIVNVSNPAAPVLASVVPGQYDDVFVAGNYAYCGSGLVVPFALDIYNIANPVAPALVGTLPIRVAGLWVSGNYVYAVSDFLNSLSVVDVTNPAAPVVVGNIAGAGAPNFLGGAWKVAVRGSYAYVSAALDNSLTIIDISNPLLPVFVGNIAGAGAPNFLGAPGKPCVSALTAPAVTTEPATDILRYSATQNGILTDHGGESCSVGFRWGTDPSNLDSSLVVGGGTSPLPFSVMVCSLLPGTTYYFEAFATNSAGTTYGSTASFTTQAVLPPIPSVPSPPTSTMLDYINIGLVIAGGTGIALILGGGKKRRILDTATGRVYESRRACAKDVLGAEAFEKARSPYQQLTKRYPGRFVELKEEAKARRY